MAPDPKVQSETKRCHMKCSGVHLQAHTPTCALEDRAGSAEEQQETDAFGGGGDRTPPVRTPLKSQSEVH